MSFCKKPKNINYVNQNRLDNYLFSHQYNPNDVEVSSNGKNCNIHIENKGKKISSNPYYYEFTQEKMIGIGGYGSVYSFVDNNKRVALALKFVGNTEEEEISNSLLNSNCKILKVINSKKQWIQAQYGFFMELADGTLSNFLYDNIEQIKSQPSILLNIAENIRKQIVCLFNIDKKYCYTDLKPENILYKCIDKQVYFMLGDLGSAVEGYGDYIASYPPINFSKSNGLLQLKNTQEKESTLAWEIGILLLFLYPFYFFDTDKQIRKFIKKDIDKLYFTNIKTATKDDITKAKNYLNELQSRLFNDNDLKITKLFGNYLDNNLELRAKSIYEPIIPHKVSPHKVSPHKKLDNLTVVELKKMAKDLGCKGYSKLLKKELILFIKKC